MKTTIQSNKYMNQFSRTVKKSLEKIKVKVSDHNENKSDRANR